MERRDENGAGPPLRARLRKTMGTLVFAALVLMVGRLLFGHGGGVDVVYRFGAGGTGVRSVRADYLEAGGTARGPLVLRTLVWDMGGAGAPDEKTHHVTLPEGNLRVALRVLASDGRWREGEARIAVPRDGGRIVVDVPEAVGSLRPGGP